MYLIFVVDLVKSVVKQLFPISQALTFQQIIQFHCDFYFCNNHELDKFMEPVIRHSFSRNAKPNVSASFHEYGELRTWEPLAWPGRF